MSQIEIIETYWNVNALYQYRLGVPFPEIIETYWNVNETSYQEDSTGYSEIIETYWNVNAGWIATERGYGIRNNRNILECKCVSIFNQYAFVVRNNRNILECK